MKRIIQKILGNKQLTLIELNEFIEKYVEAEKGKVPTVAEIQSIQNMVRNGYFKLGYAAKQYANKLGLTVISVQDIRTQQILRTDVYE